jgi:hypothetical protein
MKINSWIVLLLNITLVACSESKDELLLENVNRTSFAAFEESLNSEKLAKASSEKLPRAFLPLDTNLVFVEPQAYKRVKYTSLPMNSRSYIDSLGNFIAVYEWDKVTLDMSQDERDKIKREFDKHHEVYVTKYNELTNQLTEALGAPLEADKKLQASEMEVYKIWKSSQKWQKNNTTVELSLVLMPNELYRVIVKVLVLKEKKI